MHLNYHFFPFSLSLYDTQTFFLCRTLLCWEWVRRLFFTLINVRLLYPHFVIILFHSFFNYLHARSRIDVGRGCLCVYLFFSLLPFLLFMCNFNFQHVQCACVCLHLCMLARPPSIPCNLACSSINERRSSSTNEVRSVVSIKSNEYTNC